MPTLRSTLRMPARRPVRRAGVAVALGVRDAFVELEAVAGLQVLRLAAARQPHLAGDDDRLDGERMFVRLEDGAGRPVARHDFVVALAARRRLELAETGCFHGRSRVT